LVPLDLLEFSNIFRLIETIQPDEIYNLAAQSFVGVSFEQPMVTLDTNGVGVLRFLEIIRTVSPHSRFYQASTSEMFGKVQEVPQRESTALYPRSPYGVAKTCAHWMTVNYREAHNLFACSGILFNHESPLRGPEFVTRKITQGVARIARGDQKKITLGNLSAARDWGFAKEYVEAMWLMLQHEAPDDYVVATGETHTVHEFVEEAFAAVGTEISWKGTGVDRVGIEVKTGRTVVDVSPEFYRPAEVETLMGDASKAKDVLGWNPQTKFSGLVKMMVEADLNRKGDRAGSAVSRTREEEPADVRTIP
ncbi:MAG: GDP-mannose 4,6-dehydratase, partial [Thermoanaerobaculales bacterium]